MLSIEKHPGDKHLTCKVPKLDIWETIQYSLLSYYVQNYILILFILVYHLHKARGNIDGIAKHIKIGMPTKITSKN